MKERLLERIRRIEERKAAGPETADGQRVLHSIQRHLMLLLNTEQGSVPIDEKYGAPDFFSLLGVGDVEALGKLERMLEEIIVKYEPRLKNVVVKVDDPGGPTVNLHLLLSASLPLDDRRDLPVNFETIIDSGGRIRIE